MPLDWDPAKRLGNLAKQGVDFASVKLFEWEEALVQASLGANEPRLVVVGPIGERLHVLVYSVETATLCVISLRLANRREIERYEKA